MSRLVFRLFPILLLCCLCLSLTGFLFPVSAASAAGASVGVWLTTTDGQNQLTPQANLTFAPGSGSASSTINVNENQQFQQILGFGAAMTDTSAYLIGTKMSSAQRSALMQSLFSSNNGIGVSFVRLPMGSSDFTATPPTSPQAYSYDDLPAGQTDPNLTHFSINHDMSYIIPTLQQALQANPNLTFMANPWSPPGWMKTTGTMVGGGNLLPADYEPLAQYFVKFIQAYQAAGVPIYAVTPQNEPNVAAAGYSGMVLPPSDEANFIANNLGPAFAQAKLATKILAWDNSADTTNVESILNDAAANQYIGGVAWHCYGGNLQVMSTIHDAYAGKEEYETECSTGPTGIASLSAIDVALGSVQNWARTVELWNIALDPNGGPKMGQGCGGCTGLVTIDPSTGAFTPVAQNYYGLGQVSKFVPPGAYHIASGSGDSGLNNAAFKDPDGSKVLVVHNTSSSSDTFNVNWNSTQSFTYTLPAGGIVTFKWSGSPASLSSGYAINAGGASAGSFAADGYYSGGTPYSTTASINTSGVSNPAPQAVYQTERYGNFTYTLPNLIPGAQYTVRLHFAEIYWTSSGQRLFNVAINGQQVLSNFDIYASAGGANKALVEQFTATADANGQLAIQFSTVRDNAKVSGIEVTFASLGINAGGSASGSFAADEFASGGTPHSTTASIDTSGVSNPAPQAVYQTERFGNFTYAVSGLIAGHSYTVRLHFAEIYWTGSGQRIFNVAINGQQVLSNFDIYATAGGANKALVKQFTATADTNGQVAIQFSTVVDNAKVSGIEILA